MKAIVSTKGQVVIPQPVRKMLGIHPGDELTVKRNQNQIIMEKVGGVSAKPKLKLKKGGMPLIQMPKDAEPLTAEMVKEIAQL